MKYKIYKSSVEFTQRNRDEITTGCTSIDEEPEQIAEFESEEEARKILANYKTTIFKVGGWTEMLYQVEEYYIQDEDTFFELDRTEMCLQVEDEAGKVVSTFDSLSDAEYFINHDERDLRLMI